MNQNLREFKGEENNKRESDEKEDRDFKNINYECKFSGIIRQFGSEKILKDYYNIIEMINDKNNKKEKELNFEEIQKIFIIKNYNDKNYTLKCEYDIKTYFISIYLELIKSENQKNGIYISLKKTPFNFSYEGYKYYCFLLDDMKNYLENIKKQKTFSVIIKNCNGKRNKYEYNDNIFQNLVDVEFEIEIDYQYGGINFESINYNDIYNKTIIKKGSDLNLELGLYINLTEKEFNEFEYNNINKRIKFIKYIQDKIELTNALVICGPYGSGKTITLLKLIIESLHMNYLYINLTTVFNNSFEVIKGVLRYELIKLFREDIFKYEGIKRNKNNKRDSFLEIVKLINEYNDSKSIFTLIGSIMSLTKNILVKGQIIYFIIDQYSSKYDINKNSIKELIKNTTNNIHLIICSSLNNYSFKRDLLYSFNKSEKRHNLFNYIYIGNLLRLNNLENYKDIIKNETNEFITYLNYFGNMPLYYYSLQHSKNELNFFFEEEKERIIDEIKYFYKQEKENETLVKMYQDIFNILQIINYKKIYFFEELDNEIINLPIKYLELKKEEIEIYNLELYGYITNNDKIIKYFKNFKEIKKEELCHLIKDDNYYNNYISKISEKKRIKLYNKYNINKNRNEKITIFYLDYLFPLMEDIFSYLIYKIALKFSNNIYQELPSQSQSGLIEYIIYEKVKNSKIFLNYYIEKIEIIDNFVPNSFFIQNYISRKTENLKEYIDDNNNKIIQKKDLKKYIFFKQKQFTGKYYDCGLLILDSKNNSGYKLILFQISKRKISSHRYFREEHQLIFNRVKKKLENEYNIQINEGYFSYILSEEEKDYETIEFCDKNELNYIFFSIKELEFKGLSKDESIFNKKTFITKDFPYHNSFSILSSNNFKIKKKILEKNY